jgi:hypothetical protein
LYLPGRGWLLEAFADEERLIATPDQRGKAPFRHEAWRADGAEILFATLYERNKAIALQDEMGSNLSGDDLNSRRGKLLKLVNHIL